MVRSFARARVYITIMVLLATLGSALAETPRPAAASATITEFPPVILPLELGVHAPITTGPDGNLWFIGIGAIGRMTPAGVPTAFAAPTDGSSSAGIVTGPDGNLWFTQQGRHGNPDLIGRITPAGVVTEFPLPTVNSDPSGIAAGADGNLWFTEYQANKIGRITPAGVLTEFPTTTANSRPAGIAAGPDGNLWFTESTGNKIGRITPAGAITEFPLLTPSSGPIAIAAGPDGNLWFTEPSSLQIGRITIAGTVTEYPVPYDLSIDLGGLAAGPDGNLWVTLREQSPGFVSKYIGRITTSGTITKFPLSAESLTMDIAAGPDGALWFTDRSTQQIRRITTAGAISALPPTPAIDPSGIVTGPDGNLWFADFQYGKIGRITPVGAITLFAPPTPGSRPEDIAAGPDGALWFTENLGGAIGRITTAGVVTEFPLPTGLSAPSGITAGPDGNLWYTEGRYSKIGRITPAGVITEFATPTAFSGPDRIVAGPDGNLWFTETSADKVGRITTAGVITEFPLIDCPCQPRGIVAGPDGNLWIAESLGAITRVTTAGVVTDFLVDAGPQDIAVGPDGALWFTDWYDDGGAIGRITTAGAITEIPLPNAASYSYEIALGPDNNLWFTEDARIGRLTPGAAELVTLTLTVNGGGTVAATPSGTVTGPTTREYEAGTPVTFTPQPAAGQTFTGWTVDGVFKGWANPLTITMAAAHTVQATFASTKLFASDVPSNHTNYTAITELASRGNILGYDPTHYGPGDPVQRAQMAVLIARATPNGPGTPTNGTLTPPGCTVAGTWGCEDWGNSFTDRGGVPVSLWRAAGTLQHYNVAFGYTAQDCANQGRAFPCYGPTDRVSYAQTIAFIARAMIAKGYWVAQPNAPLPGGNVPGVLATPIRTFAFYTGGIPDAPADWNAGASRGWFAEALWAALDSYWGTDGNLPDGRAAGGYTP